MSLIKQLWIAVAIVMSIAFGGSLVMSTLSARHYLEQQLYVKNLDNATSLALSLSQMPKDPVTVELQIAAQFDAGHYRSIRLTAPDGQLIAEREFQQTDDGAPGWFTRLIPIRAPAGIAQVQDGWRQFGTLTLESHTRYVYESLWSGTLQLLWWFLGGGALTGLIGTLMIKHITRPLGRVVAQAEAIGGRRFVTTEEPSTSEFRSLVRAMNMLSERVRGMLAEETQRLEALRRQTQYDEVTGLVNRDHFLNLVDAALLREDATSGGVLLVARLSELTELNRELGRREADRLLREIATCCRAAADAHPGWEAGRLNATDFCVLAEGCNAPEDAARDLSARLRALQDEWQTKTVMRLPIGGTAYLSGEARSSVLMRADGALAASELGGATTVRVAAAEGAAPVRADHAAWRQEILDALRSHGVRLTLFPAIAKDGSLLHFEAPMRLFVDGSWRNAGYFMPWAARLGLEGRLDTAVIDAALNEIANSGKPVGVNLSAESLRDAGFRTKLFSSLQAHPQHTSHLWLELPESDVVRDVNEFRALCLALKPLGCRLGIEHVGRQFDRIGDLHELGLDYLKIDSSVIRQIDTNVGNQGFVRGLCTVTHAIGLTVIAEGVTTEAERKTLFALGMDGVTGPGVSLRTDSDA